MPEATQAEQLYEQSGDLFVHGHYEECLELITQAISLDASNPHYYSGRADAHYELGNYHEAIADYQQAIALKQDDVYSMINCGCVFEKLHNWQEAMTLYDAAIAAQPTSAIAHYNRGGVLNQFGRKPEAFESYTRAITLFPEFAGAYLNRGHVLSRMGKHEEAMADYNQAEALGKEDINIAWTVTWSRFGKQPIGAKDAEHLLAIAELLPGDLHYVFFMCHALIALQQGNLAVALTHLERARSMDADQWDPPLWIGMVLAMQGDMVNALQAIEQALELGLPPLFLTPLYWLEEQQPAFFKAHTCALLDRGTREHS